MRRCFRCFRFMLLPLALCASVATHAANGPDCSRRLTLGLHDHGLLYSADTDTGIDRDIADALIARSGCKIAVSLMPRARIWQLIESGALDFSLSGISNRTRNRFASFAWYFSNKYYLLVRRDAEVNSLSDFLQKPRLQLGVIRSFRYSKNANQLLDQMAAAQRVEYATRLDPLYQILAVNRIQGMIIEPFDYSQVEDSPIRALTHIVDTGDPAIPHGLIMSNKSISPQERQKWRALVDAMRADGTILRIFEKYFSPEQAKSMVEF